MANDQKDGESLPVENIVLVGRTGNGKSATGNSIVGIKDAFISKTKAAGVTMVCKSEIVEFPGGPKLRVIDTPGLFDLTATADYISREIINCLHQAEGGLHAVLLVFTVKNRVTDEQEKVLSTLEVLFGSEIVNYLIIVFTAADELDDGDTIQDYLKDGPDFLLRLIESCDQRLVVFDNKTTDDLIKKKQVQDLLNAVEMVRKHTNYTPYTEDMYQKIKDETERHNKEHDELAKKEVTEEEFQKLREELMLINAQNLKSMAKMMEDNIQKVMDAQEKIFEQREKAEADRHHREEEIHQQEMQDKLSQMETNHQNELKAQMAKGHGCNIL